MWASPEQQAAARGMKNVKLHKSAKPGKIQRHAAGRIRRNALKRLALLRVLRSGVRRLDCALKQPATSHFGVRSLESALLVRRSLGEGGKPPTQSNRSLKAASSASGTLRAAALQKLDLLLKMISALFGGLGKTMGCAAGGGATAGSFSSGSDPPAYTVDAGSALPAPLMQKMLPYVAGVASLIATALPMKSDAALMTTSDPVAQTSAYALDYSFKNNDPGTYNTATTDLTKSVAQSLFDLRNHSYSSVDSLANGELTPTIAIPPTGDLFTGWGSTSQNGGEVKFENDGLVPEGTYNIWDNEKMALTTTVGYDLLEQNTQSGHQAFTIADIETGIANNTWNPDDYDAIVVKSDDAILDYLIAPLTVAQKTATFTGTSQSGFTEWDTTGSNYVVLTAGQMIPEPTTLGLVGLTGLAALFLSRRFRRG